MTERLTQPELLREAGANDNTGPVTCLGLTFADAAERRAYFTARLREHLQDPTFRTIEGFPLGDDEDILDLSDPPYYTACPNPFLPQIMAEWQAERAVSHTDLGMNEDTYHSEPFTADISEGKSDPIYNAHSYHTKVPHKAIMRYILHYTEPGDIIFDGFCGTGMTGVAAQLCGDRKTVESLGYRVTAEGAVYEGDKAISRVGARKAVLNDLSPAATFIAYNYNTPVDVAAFAREAQRILQEVENKYGWMYETWHPHCDDPDRVKARINYTVWSEVFSCSSCGEDIIFLDEALDEETGKVSSEFPCPSCGVLQTKRKIDRLFTSYFDPHTKSARKKVTYRPVLISYDINSNRKNYKKVDSYDLSIIKKLEQSELLPNIPVNRFPIEFMYHGSRLAPKGFEYIHDLYLLRQATAWAAMWESSLKSNARIKSALRFMIEQAFLSGSMLNAYRPTGFSQVSQYMKGVYYVPAQISEISPWYIFAGKQARLCGVFTELSRSHRGSAAILTSSTTKVALPVNSVDYIFTDPPFGENIFYADLNIVTESWHRVMTDSTVEAIIDKPKQKKIGDYQELMRLSFKQYYSCLKPGRWMTVEFHNSHDSVWRAIQEALMSVGFVVADVRTLDKQQGSYRQVTSNAAKQDLIISAYKPTDVFEQQFLSHAGSAAGVWDFVHQHLAQVPPVVVNNGILETVAERQNYLLFDRMVAYHIQRGIAVPMGAAQFYAGLDQYFAEQDGMYFLPDQVAEYNKARLEYGVVAQMNLFVSDEKSAINWLRYQLQAEPMSFQQIQPRFLQELHQARHEDLPDLKILLEQSFLPDDEGRWYVPDPNRAEDLEKLRLRGLLREFAQYKESKKKLRQFRSEAMRAGFSHAWHERDYATIVEVAERLPEQVLQEDPELLMYYDNASLRVGS